jgi:hypothetical protein
MYEEMRNGYKIFVGEPEDKNRVTGTTMYTVKWEDRTNANRVLEFRLGSSGPG